MPVRFQADLVFLNDQTFSLLIRFYEEGLDMLNSSQEYNIHLLLNDLSILDAIHISPMTQIWSNMHI